MKPKLLERTRPKISILDFTPSRITSFLRDRFADKGVREAYIFGSFAQGNCTAWSDLDIVIVKQTDQPFVERPREFPEVYELGIPVDLLVYTPEEMVSLKGSGSTFWREFERQKVRIL
jgi:predicted nucleotidyltransferase